MASRSISLSGALAPVAALLMGTALLYLGYGLQAVLVPLRADMEGFSRIVVGLLGSTYYAGFVAGCLFAPYLILRSGHIRAFAAMVSCLSAAALAFPLLLGEAEWLLFRFAIGFCFSGLLVIVESWLNERATNATRGIVMSAYVVITYVCISVGQLGVARAAGHGVSPSFALLLHSCSRFAGVPRGAHAGEPASAHFRWCASGLAGLLSRGAGRVRGRCS